MNTAEAFLRKKHQIIPRASNIKLKQNYKHSELQLHLFFEDQDDFEFFRIAIKMTYIGYVFIPYYQKGKKNVLDTYKDIDWQSYNKSKVLFFVDKDYDDLLNIQQVDDHNVFVTNFYSIENYLVNLESLKIVLLRFHSFDEGGLLDKVVDVYKKSYQIFAECMLTLTSFILIYRREEMELKLDSLKLQSLFHFDQVHIIYKKYASSADYKRIMKDDTSTSTEKNQIRKNTILEILSQCGDDPSVFHWEKLLKNKVLLRGIPESKSYIRGKYDLWFFLQFFSRLEIYLKPLFNDPSTKDLFGGKPSYPKRKTELNASNIFDMLSSKISIPEDINKFLTHNYTNLNANS